eukprot:m.176756 g.176756  ORF g.176756 m.176756 type:complete len:56 (+) comp39145_c1_seq4:65-232(+)
MGKPSRESLFSFLIDCIAGSLLGALVLEESVVDPDAQTFNSDVYSECDYDWIDEG